MRFTRYADYQEHFQKARSPLNKTAQSGFTIIELVVVISIFALISVFAARRFDAVFGWQAKSELRRLVTTWEMLSKESSMRGETYRLVLNLEDQTYKVLREVPLQEGEVRQVDYLSNLRTQGEQKRRQEAAEDKINSVSEEFEAEAERQSGDLQSLFYQSLFPTSPDRVRLSIPLEFPSLAEPRSLPPEVVVTSVEFSDREESSGTAYLRFTPFSSQELAVVHVKLLDNEYTLIPDWTSRTIELKSGYVRIDDVVDDISEAKEALSEQL